MLGHGKCAKAADRRDASSPLMRRGGQFGDQLVGEGLVLARLTRRLRIVGVGPMRHGIQGETYVVPDRGKIGILCDKFEDAFGVRQALS
jgi:hypothetical protein